LIVADDLKAMERPTLGSRKRLGNIEEATA
jgi:hypothetical protein